MAGRPAALYCSLSTVRPVKQMFWVTPNGRRVPKSGVKGRLSCLTDLVVIHITRQATV